MCMLFPWSRISPNMEGLLTEMRIAMYMCILFPWPPISPTWRVLQREMRIAMSVCVYYSLDHVFPKHGGGCSQKWELHCLYIYIIPLITYFSIKEGDAVRNENCNVCICISSLDHIFPKHGGGCSQKWELQCLFVYIIPLIIYFPKHVGGCSHKRELQCICVCYSLGHVFPQIWSGCSQKWELQCICVYYSRDHLFPQRGGCCREKWELQCLCVYIIPLITYFPNMEGGAHRNENCIVCIYILFLWSPIFPSRRGMLWEMRIAMYVFVYHPLITYFPNMEGVAHRNENCNVCIWILFLWSPIFPLRRGMLREMRIAMYVFVYYSIDHIFPKHGVGYSQKWTLQCLYVYIIPLITYFLKHVVSCSHKRELQCICVCYSLGHVFPQIWRGCSQRWELQCICVYYSLDHLFPQHGGCCREKWQLQCLCVYIIPLITYFPNMEGVAHKNENCIVCMCILFLWSPIFPSWRGMQREIRIAMSVCVYYSLDHLFPQHGGGCSQKWELHCLYIYIIPLITYFSIKEGDAERNENCNVCICISSLDHIFPKHGGGCSQKWELQCLFVYIIPLITYFPKHVGGCSHKRELQCICVCYSLVHVLPQIWSGCSQKWELQCICEYYSRDHLFPQRGGCCREKWELQCLCVYIIPLITYFPNMEGVAHRNENCIVCICILFLWSTITPTWKGFLTEMIIAMSARVYYSHDHLFPQHGVCCREKWELRCLCVYIIPLITYFPNMEGVAQRNENCNVCMCILFLWSPIFPSWRGMLREMRIAMSVCVYFSLDHLFPQHWGGCSQKWELHCLYMYIIPLITYFPNMEEVSHRNDNCNVCTCILFPWSPISPPSKVLRT